jgi:hypothetical protein
MPQYLSADQEKELMETAALLMTKGKGILAADESTGMSSFLFDDRHMYRLFTFVLQAQ